MAAFSRGASTSGMLSCVYTRTFQAPLQSSTSITPFLAVFQSQQRWLTTSHILRAQAARKETTSEVKKSIERAQRSINRTSDPLLKWTEAQKQRAQSTAAAKPKVLPEPREFDLVGSSEAYYMSSKAKQKSLRELLPNHSTLPKSAAIEAKPPSQISQAISSVRKHIPFFGIAESDSSSSTAKDEPESYSNYDDVDVHPLYNARNTRASTITVAVLVGLVLTTCLGLVSMMAISFSYDYQPGAHPFSNRYVDWVKLLQGFGLAFLTFCTVGAYKSRVGLVKKVRFFPRGTAIGQSKPWMRANLSGRSKIKSNANTAEGTIEVTSRTWMPFGQRTQSFDVSEVWLREPIIMQRLRWENENGPLENLRAGETVSGRKLGWLRTFAIELRDIVFKTRIVRLYGPTSSFRRAFTRQSKSWLLDLKQFTDTTEKEFGLVVPLKSKR